jgi:hypothetical protein
MGFPDGGRNMSETVREVMVYFCVLQRFRRVRKITKTTVGFVMSVRMEQLGSHWKDFHKFDV